MESNILPNILLGILALLILITAVQKIISSVRLSRSEKARRQAEFDARSKAPSDKLVQRIQTERARVQEKEDARVQAHFERESSDRERIRREYPVTDSGDNSMYIAALAAAGCDHDNNHHSGSHHASHDTGTSSYDHGSTSGWSDHGSSYSDSSSSSSSDSSSSSSDGGGGGGGGD